MRRRNYTEVIGPEDDRDICDQAGTLKRRTAQTRGFPIGAMTLRFRCVKYVRRKVFITSICESAVPLAPFAATGAATMHEIGVFFVFALNGLEAGHPTGAFSKELLRLAKRRASRRLLLGRGADRDQRCNGVQRSLSLRLYYRKSPTNH